MVHRPDSFGLSWGGGVVVVEANTGGLGGDGRCHDATDYQPIQVIPATIQHAAKTSWN